jgi:transcription initiation factor TFIID TATA-box-binding protein
MRTIVTKVEIVNVVATATLNQPMDFSKLKNFPEINYSTDVYRGMVAYFKSTQMQGRVSIFRTGKMISVGTKSEVQAFKELKLAMDFLVERNLAKVVDLQPKIQNLVVSADFESSINLEEVSEKTRAIYEPEQFPSAISRFEEPYKTSILIFTSGKAVITGLRSLKQIEPTIHVLRQQIELNQ